MSSDKPAVGPGAVPALRGGRSSRTDGARQAVIDAVQELLTVTRLSDLTVNDIVDRAGISRPTFYSHFETKYSVVAAFIREMTEGIYAIWQSFFEGEGEIEEAELRVIALQTIQVWRSQAVLFIATVEGWHTNSEIHAAWGVVLDRFSAALADRIRRSPHAYGNEDLIAAAMVALFERCQYELLTHPDGAFGCPDEEVAAMLAHVWARSVTA